MIDIKTEVYKLIQHIESTDSYVINEASALSHFVKNKSDQQYLLHLINSKIVFSLGAYLDSSNQSLSKVPTLIYDKISNYNHLLSYVFQIQTHQIYSILLGMDVIQIIYNQISQKYEFSIHFRGKYPIKFEKNVNTVSYLSIFIEYILSNHTIEEIIDKKNKNNNTKIAIISEYSEVYHKKYVKMFTNLLIFLFTRNRSMPTTTIGLHITTLPEVIDFLHKYNIQTFIDSYDDEMIIDDLRKIFQKNIYKEEFYLVLYIYGRIKLMGDFIQLLEVDQYFKKNRAAPFRSQKGYLITQYRMLGSYCSTLEDINYMCKSTLHDGIYYFYRNI